MRIRISVALCTRDGEAHLGEQLASIAGQSRPPAELVVCDDASDDGSIGILESFAADAPFPVRIERNAQPLGVTANFSRAFELCRGDVICPCDQDDRWREDKLERVSQAFGVGVGLVFSDLSLCDEGLQPLGRTEWQALGFTPADRRRLASGGAFGRLLRFNVVTGAAMAFRTDLRDLVLPIPEHWIHDEWIALLSAAVSEVVAIDEALVSYRGHAGQRIGAAPSGWRRQWAHARQHMDADYFRRMVRRVEAAQERLGAGDAGLRDPRYTDLLDAKLEHARRRLRLHAEPGGRLPRVLGELSRGGYHRFGYGWRSALQDLLL